MLPDVEPHNMLWGLPAFIIAWGFHFAIPLVLSAVGWIRRARAAMEARAADRTAAIAGTAITPGFGCIHGPVEYAPGSKHAVTVTVCQVGTNHKGKNNSWSHSWSETDRTVNATPFYVRDDRGARIRVEPDDKTLVVDKLDRTVRRGEMVRERIAEVTEGETVYVVGALVPGADPARGGYRDVVETSLVMRPPSNGRLLVSSEPLGDRYREQAKSLKGVASFWLGFLLVFSLADVGFHARVFAGRTDVAVIAQRIPHPGNKSSSCELEVELPNKKREEVDTSFGWCSRLRDGEKVPVYVVGDGSFIHLGHEPGLHIASLAISFVILVFGVIVSAFQARPWYAGKVRDTGSGKLSEAQT